MAPFPYNTYQKGADFSGFVCPHCHQSLHASNRTVSCTDCRYVPRQGAD